MEKLLAVGLDVSKLTIDACFGGRDIIQVKNNPSGIETLIERIREYEKQSYCIHACCEYTGNYYLALANALFEQGIKISVVNPLSIKLYADYNLRRTKTDKQDARLIALYCQKESPPAWRPLPVSRANLKNLNRRIDQLLVLLNAEQNRHQVADERVKPSIERMMGAIQSEIENCRAELQSVIESDAGLHQQQKLLTGIVGVGKTTAAWLLSVLVDMDKFASAKKLISYLGLSPIIKQSGTSVKAHKLSKMGDKSVRKALYPAARAACLNSKLWRPWFEAKIKQGKHPKQVYVLMMVKIVKYAYAILKSGQPFDKRIHSAA
ncbi:IS110 family transposase [Neisseria shayeganii]|uniref:IS110 family transposase n=1 Tax=Neisseria shayeganii TaxID=607712 RepID=A0A7D7SIK3_9NEIS|nr:IS110 family transposase [Neisseria shayeganii]